MASLPRFSVVFKLTILLQLCLWAQGYAIDESCSVPHITAAMAEVREMAELARDQVVKPLDRVDNTKNMLFPWAMSAESKKIQGYYSKVLSQIPWDVTNNQMIALDRVTIYCSDASLIPLDIDNALGESWIDTKSTYVFTDRPHHGNASARFCEEGENAVSLTARNNNVVLLCDAVLAGAPRYTVKQKYDLGELTIGLKIQDFAVVAFTLLHEVFHVALSSTMRSGPAEIYGWDACTLPSLSTQDTMVNPDSLAYYGMALKTVQMGQMVKDFFFTSGVLKSRSDEEIKAMFRAAEVDVLMIDSFR
ncbi:hypothetical protein BDV95DRAFT_610232 [Massariosphaeria phaeospora]|uniref:Lysine-specific metallo-endopeptidase domain-containing protein n=1 Tax=Massariosphaeria phaeospora TaxID=100035 RepID=A0A7C8I946_9PLEO|nr:hypothetical protein BDV95DRAFT_610232 [Massariosphaeria phaeospora]